MPVRSMSKRSHVLANVLFTLFKFDSVIFRVSICKVLYTFEGIQT